MYLAWCDSVIIRNNTIYDNHQQFHAGGEGGGIYIFFCQSILVENNIVMQNDRFGILAYVTTTLHYNDFWTNADDYYGIAPGEFDISEDPLRRCSEWSVSSPTPPASTQGIPRHLMCGLPSGPLPLPLVEGGNYLHKISMASP